ncbi:hypothetical protein CKJ85_09080 [Corynebacterium sp. NML 150383]|nr:VanW family protein [Corynebacterium sp. NML 150383]PAT03321.1 hypothetical protein CKJ85_09080 [Corynebacterium sp. NML 150383]
MLAVVLAVYLADLALNRGNVPRGTTVGGVAIGGMSPDEARERLQGELGDVTEQPVEVTAADKRAQLVPAAAGLGIDWQATVDAAGIQSANPIPRLTGLFTQHEVDVQGSVDKHKLDPELARVKDELYVAPVDGAIHVDGGKANVTDPKLGQEVNPADLETAVTDGWLDPEGVDVEPQPVEPAINDAAITQAMDGPIKAALGGPLTVNGRDGVTATIPQERMGEVVQFNNVEGRIQPDVHRDVAGAILGEALDGTQTEMRNARVLEGGGVEPSQDGTEVDWDVTFDGFEDRLLGHGERTWDAAYRPVEADFTTEDAQNATFNEEVGSFTTGGFSGPSGTNIALVAQTVNGAIVNPGETFSLNGYTGPRGTAQGYVESGIILNGHSDMAVGGGISQFATTLYNAAYFAGMTDIAHTPHSYYISRYPVGREATVYEGAIDLQFRNDSNHPVRIQTGVSGGELTVSLMGVKTVRVESANGGRWAQTQPNTMNLSGATCSPSGGSPGFTTSDTRSIYDLSGNLIDQETQTTVYDPEPIVKCG